MELQTGSAVWIANDSFIKHCACLLRRLLLSPPSSSPPVTRSMACSYSICTPSPPSSSSSLSLSFQSRKETTQTAVSLYLTTKCSVCAAICYVQAGQRLQARWSFTRASKCCSTRHKIAAPKREQLRHSRRPARSTVVVREFEVAYVRSLDVFDLFSFRQCSFPFLFYQRFPPCPQPSLLP